MAGRGDSEKTLVERDGVTVGRRTATAETPVCGRTTGGQGSRSHEVPVSSEDPLVSQRRSGTNSLPERVPTRSPLPVVYPPMTGVPVPSSSLRASSETRTPSTTGRPRHRGPGHRSPVGLTTCRTKIRTNSVASENYDKNHFSAGPSDEPVKGGERPGKVVIGSRRGRRGPPWWERPLNESSRPRRSLARCSLTGGRGTEPPWRRLPLGLPLCYPSDLLPARFRLCGR